MQYAGADLRAAWLGTYPPLACGIETFTRDLAAAAAALPRPVAPVVPAIDGHGGAHAFDPVLRVRLEDAGPDCSVAAARRLNRLRGVDVVCVQHGFGALGRWRDGCEEGRLVSMLAALDRPAVVTLHAVTPHPNRLLRETVLAMAERAAAIVVPANIARVLLQEDYGLSGAALAKVVPIPHGVPAGAAPSPDAAKLALGLGGRRVLATFGLLHEGKGVEYMLEAVPALIDRYPDLLYLVLGETHPEARERRGEAYRHALLARCRELGIERHVRFVDRYLPQHELAQYLAATDVCVTPYLARDRISSGALAYALGCGKAIVSTPYLYAAEALAEGRGVLAEFRSPASLAGAVDRLLGDSAFRRATAARAAAYGRVLAWPAVAARYRALFLAVLGRPADRPEPADVAAGRSAVADPLVAAATPTQAPAPAVADARASLGQGQPAATLAPAPPEPEPALADDPEPALTPAGR